MNIGDFLNRILAKLNQSTSQPQYDRNTQQAAAVAQAAIVDGYIGDLDSPAVLEEKLDFQLGVTILNVPCFTSEDLLQLSLDPTAALWQMAVAAVSRRDPDPALVDTLLSMFDDGGPWHQHFVMKALLVHTPLDRSLVGEIVFKFRDQAGPYLEFTIKVVAPVLTQRVDDGEEPTFGSLLDQLNAEKAEQLQAALSAAQESPLQTVVEPLRDELGQWLAAFIDQAALRAIGRIWDARALTEPLVIDHPDLALYTQDVLRSLAQSPRRSVLITGEHGVGKSAVMFRVGRELMEQGWTIFEASGSDIIAGQRFIGDLEQRVRDLVGQVGGGRRVLWYVPDFQSLGWTGTHQFSQSSVLDLLLPFLETGQVVVVGELPIAAYEQLSQDQPRLTSACMVCRVAPLGETATIELATAWARALGSKDDRELLPAATLREAWLLASQYLRDREPPGCLMDFLEQTRQSLLTAATGPVQISHDDLIATLAAITSLPRQILDERQNLDPQQLRTFFGQRILGQPEAVDCLVERIALIKAGLTDPSRPQGVFLFAGPTGTGKTEIAKALAKFLFGSDERLLRYDMSEFQSPDSLERLVGDGQKLDQDSLTRRIRKQPFSIILLDEFEKAHPRVWDLFLQVFDDGRLTDPLGRTSDFRHAIVILTSNLGGQTAARAGLGFDQDSGGFRVAEVDRAVAQAFRPEFLNRLDRVIVFRPFTREVMREILDKELQDVQQRRGLRNREWAVVWEDSALEFLLDRGFSPALGARPLKRAIERYLLTPLAETIVQGAFPVGDQFLYIQAQDDRLLAEFIDPEAPDDSPREAALAGGDGPCAPDADGAPSCLAAIALHPGGSAAEYAELVRYLEQLRGQIESSAWRDAKSLALSMMALPEFWDSPDRHAVLGEVEYRERVENGLATAGNLVEKIAPTDAGAAPRYPRKLVGQAAGRLHLLELAHRSLESQSTWEAIVSIEGMQGSSVEDDRADKLVDRLGDMYRQWGKRRKMRILVLEDRPHRSGRGRSLLLGVSGYAAHDILSPETGLHIWEHPDPRGSKSSTQARVLVRVAPLPDDRSADGVADWLAAAREVMAGSMPGAPAIVRIYRELPDPLVKDRIRGWRTGRLDRVLDGDFDLLGACAETAADEGLG